MRINDWSSDVCSSDLLGLDSLKFFPAATTGGIPALKALAGPFGGINFCPTGGISAAPAPDWLALDPVRCVGGRWVAPSGPPDPLKIEDLAPEASARSRHCITPFSLSSCRHKEAN